MLQVWLTTNVATSGTRTPMGLAFLAFPDWQTFGDVDAVHPLVVDIGVLRAQQIVNHAVASAPARMGLLDDLLAQFDVESTGTTDIGVGVSAWPNKGTGVAFRHVVLAHQASNGLAFDLWG